MERIDHLLPWSTLGSEKRLSVFRFGCGARKVYIQSSLHADELPGMRTAWELKQRLRLLEAEGRLRGTVELVPVANPVGLGQMIQALHQGRFEMSSGRNFNRDFPDLLDAVIDSVGERLGSVPAADVALVRQALRAALDALPPATSELEGMQRLLYRHACDADLVLDLHCDFEAAIHLYTLPQQWPAFASLAARLGAAVGLLAEESGGGSFDEACSVPWLRLSRLYPRAELPLACLATTVELGGQADTTVQQAEANAAAILAFLAEQGFVEGEWPAAPRSLLRRLALRGHRIRPRPAYRRGEFPAPAGRMGGGGRTAVPGHRSPGRPCQHRVRRGFRRAFRHRTDALRAAGTLAGQGGRSSTDPSGTLAQRLISREHTHVQTGSPRPAQALR